MEVKSYLRGNIQYIDIEEVKTLIIGSSPAGCTAVIYTRRASIQPVLYSELQSGGQLITTAIIENFPGFHEGIDANQLISETCEQTKFYGADPCDGSIVKVDLSSCPFYLEDEHGDQIEAEAVIIATGTSAKYLGLPDEEKYRGQGVSTCTTCDGFFYRRHTTAVVGGGDTAYKEAMYFSGLAKEVYTIVRKLQLRTTETIYECVAEEENIEILYGTNTLGLFDESGVEGVHLVRFKGEENEEKFDISIGGFFLAIGYTPSTDLSKDRSRMDDHGSIITKSKSTATDIEGVFTAGDVADPTYRQGIVAVGTGTMAAIEVDRFLQKQ